MQATQEHDGFKTSTRKQPNLMMVRGTPFAGYFYREYIESAMDYVHRKDDLFIVTYVKCGTTWMQHIVYLIQNDGVPPANAVEFYKASPFIEICGADCMQWVKRPGAVKTHLPLHQMRCSPEAKYIVVIRNPFDVLVSMHHFWFMISAYEYEGDFNDSFENFMNNYMESGDYFAFYRDWYERSADPNVLFVVYEDMKKDPEAAVLKVARFLGPEYEQRLLANDGKILKDVIKYSRVDEMKKYTNDMIHDFYATDFAFQGEQYSGLRKFHEVVHNARSREDGPAASADKIYYVRKGVVGDWKNYFSPEQEKRLKERFQKETRGSGIANLWPDMGFHGRKE
nr:sulfotransferase 1E1-like [Rhipicephalus microplus]